MHFNDEELLVFQKIMNSLEDKLEPTHACVLLKVLYYYIQNASTTIRFQLQPEVLKRLDQRKYADYDPLVYEDLKTGFRIIAMHIQEFEDDDYGDGVYVVPTSENEIKVKVRASLNYCKEVGKSPSELSAEELEPFLNRNRKK